MSGILSLHAARSDDRTVLTAPKLGRYSLDVVPGAIVDSHVDIGRVYVLELSWALRLPAGVSGRVVSIASRARRHPLAFGDEVITLAPLVDAGDSEHHAHQTPGAAAGSIEFAAPMDGQFYRRPSPGEPPFVPDGALVQPGERIGLIEVMKFFYPIRWEGSEPARLVSFAVGDAVAVTAGQTLAWFERA